MIKEQAIEKLEALKGVPKAYGGKVWKLKSYSINDETERVYITTEQGNNYDRLLSTLNEFLEQLEPLKETNLLTEIVSKSSDTKKSFTELKDILMNNIENLRLGRMDISTAKEISHHAQTIVNITKVELEYFKK